MNALNSIVSSFGLSINFNNLSYFTIALALIFVFRIVQRIYYFSRGHQQYFTEYLPSNDLGAFFKVNSISVKDTSVVSGDGVKLKYRIIGEGKKIIYLGNIYISINLFLIIILLIYLFVHE